MCREQEIYRLIFTVPGFAGLNTNTDMAGFE